jgi:predicted nucleic acid-binding protein
LQLLFAQDTIGELIYVTKNFVRHNLKNISDRLNALQLITVLFYYGTSVNTMKTDYQKSNDQYDDMFLKCAIQGEADYLITDDIESGMHTNDIKKLGVKVVTSEEFIKIYEKSTEASD